MSRSEGVPERSGPNERVQRLWESRLGDVPASEGSLRWAETVSAESGRARVLAVAKQLATAETAASKLGDPQSRGEPTLRAAVGIEGSPIKRQPKAHGAHEADRSNLHWWEGSTP
jgi:hypothetical protein